MGKPNPVGTGLWKGNFAAELQAGSEGQLLYRQLVRFVVTLIGLIGCGYRPWFAGPQLLLAQHFFVKCWDCLRMP